MPTSRSTLRGLAVLCLLCVLPRLRATVLTISQSTSFQVDSWHDGRTLVQGGSIWFYEAFDSSLGTLESVSISVAATATVAWSDRNLYSAGPFTPGTPLTVTPFALLNLSAQFGDLMAPPLTATDSSSGETIVVAPGGLFSYGDTLTVSTNTTTTNPLALERFSTGTPVDNLGVLNLEGHGYGMWGGISMKGNVTATLNYNFRVGEKGESSSLLLGALLTIFTLRRLVRRHGITKLPTLT